MTYIVLKAPLNFNQPTDNTFALSTAVDRLKNTALLYLETYDGG